MKGTRKDVQEDVLEEDQKGVEEGVQEDVQKGVQEDVQVGVQKDVQVGVQKDVQVLVQKDVQVGVQKDVQVGVQKDVQVGVQKDVQVGVQKDVQVGVQKEAQKGVDASVFEKRMTMSEDPAYLHEFYMKKIKAQQEERDKLMDACDRQSKQICQLSMQMTDYKSEVDERGPDSNAIFAERDELLASLEILRCANRRLEERLEEQTYMLQQAFDMKCILQQLTLEKQKESTDIQDLCRQKQEIEDTANTYREMLLMLQEDLVSASHRTGRVQSDGVDISSQTEFRCDTPGTGLTAGTNFQDVGREIASGTRSAVESSIPVVAPLDKAIRTADNETILGARHGSDSSRVTGVSAHGETSQAPSCSKFGDTGCAEIAANPRGTGSSGPISTSSPAPASGGSSSILMSRYSSDKSSDGGKGIRSDINPVAEKARTGDNSSSGNSTLANNNSSANGSANVCASSTKTTPGLPHQSASIELKLREQLEATEISRRHMERRYRYELRELKNLLRKERDLKLKAEAECQRLLSVAMDSSLEKNWRKRRKSRTQVVFAHSDGVAGKVSYHTGTSTGSEDSECSSEEEDHVFFGGTLTAAKHT